MSDKIIDFPDWLRELKGLDAKLYYTLDLQEWVDVWREGITPQEYMDLIESYGD